MSAAQHQEWEKCPDGVLSRLPEAIDDRERRRFLTFIGCGSASLIMVSLIGGTVAQTMMQEKGPYSCRKTRELVELYVASRLNQQQRSLVLAHLSVCSHCASFYAAFESKQKNGCQTAPPPCGQ